MIRFDKDNDPHLTDIKDLESVKDIYGNALRIGDYIRVFEYHNKFSIDDENCIGNLTGEKGELLFITDCLVDCVDGEVCALDILYEQFTYRPELNDTLTEHTYRPITDLMRFDNWKNKCPIIEFEVIKYF